MEQTNENKNNKDKDIMATKEEIKETKQHLKVKYDVEIDLILDTDSKSENWIKEAVKEIKESKKKSSS